MTQTRGIEKSKWYDKGLRFACTQCGNCCTGPPGYVWVSDDEAIAMAHHLNLSLDQFLDQYTRLLQGRRSLNEVPASGDAGFDCVFLDRDAQGKALCTVYPVRPVQCRTWPFWPENLASRRAWHRAARNCPGMKQGIENQQGTFYPVEHIRIQRDRTPTL